MAVNCRIDAGRLAIDRLEEEEPAIPLFILKGDEPLSDAQLRCYGDAFANSGLFPSIENEEIGRRFDGLVDHDMLQQARRFLRDMGLLGRLPRRGRNEPLGAFALRLERLCRAPPGSVLGVENGRIALVGEEPSSSEDRQAWLCAVHAAEVIGYRPLVPPPPEPAPPIAIP